MYSHAYIFKDTQTERHIEAHMQTRTYVRYADFWKRHSCTEETQLEHKQPHNWRNTEAYAEDMHTEEKKKYMWKSVGAPREHPVHRLSEAGTRISLQVNIYVEIYMCPVTL